MSGRLVWGSPEWFLPALALVVLAALFVVRSRRYWARQTRLFGWAAALKLTGLVALAVAICNPLWRIERPRPGANEFWIVADNSRSLRLQSADAAETRGQQLRQLLDSQQSWLGRLEQDFRLRRLVFDRNLRSVRDFEDLHFEGTSSDLYRALAQVGQRCEGRPCAGIVLLTDGNATDPVADASVLARLAPVYSVVPDVQPELRDISVARVEVTQSNFEATPVTIRGVLNIEGDFREDLVAQLVDEHGSEVQRQRVMLEPGRDSYSVQFQFRPETAGVVGYRLCVFASSDEAAFSQQQSGSETTFENNARWCVVDRGGGPYRVLYVSGRSNWEYKFLRRAVLEDEEVELAGIIRVAKREPRFTFRGRPGERSNPLFRGFDQIDEEDAERYDQPVLIRIDDTRSGADIPDRFPRDEEELFVYDALILDDLEAEFFTADQQQVVRDFVSRRGGALLMLGGPNSLADGAYQSTPIGSLLPIFLDASMAEEVEGPFRIELTREGWLEPWVRLRASESLERTRLAESPALLAASQVGRPRAGASILSELVASDGRRLPMLVAQRFGAGKSAVLVAGDMWRWHMRANDDQQQDLAQFWRQTVRWLVSDVPHRLQVDIQPADRGKLIEMQVRTRDFAPAGKAEVKIDVEQPEGTRYQLSGRPDAETLGAYQATAGFQQPGFYRATVSARLSADDEALQRQIGWTSDAAADEFARLRPDVEQLQRVADATGGQVLRPDQLTSWVERIPPERVPIVETRFEPLWHRWWWLALALVGLGGEWALRRFHGLA